jgi:hypothetical protein
VDPEPWRETHTHRVQVCVTPFSRMVLWAQILRASRRLAFSLRRFVVAPAFQGACMVGQSVKIAWKGAFTET